MPTALEGLGASVPSTTDATDYGVWGAILNAALQAADRALGATASITTTGGTTALSDAQNDCAIIALDGTLTTNAIIEVKARKRLWMVRNDTAGAFSVTLRVVGGGGDVVVVTQGKVAFVYTDGTDCAKVDLDNLSGIPTTDGAVPIPDILRIYGTTPTLRLEDTTASAYSFAIRADANQVYLLVDTNGDGTYEDTNKLWHAGNDGSGSGSDADMLDGYQASAFGLLAATQTWAGVNTFENTLRVDLSGNRVELGSGSIELFRSDGVPFLDFKDLISEDYDVRFGKVSGQKTLNVTGSGGGGVLMVEGNTVWHGGNDGSGSGADTDLVRGVTPSTFGLSLLDDADAAAARTTLGLGAGATQAIATAAEFRANTADKLLETDGVWSAAASVALTDGATITPDFNAAFNFTLAIGGNRTLANPTNQKVGQSGSIQITQDATGSRTLAYGSNWKFAGGVAPTLSTAAGTVDVLFYQVVASGRIVCNLVKGVT